MTLIAAPRRAGHEPGRRMVLLGVAATLSVLVIDLLLAGRVTMFFDLSFIVLCLALAVHVDRGDFFAVGLLPPALMVGAFTLVAWVDPAALADPRDNTVQAVITGIAHHSVALAVGYALCLLTLGARMLRD